MMTIIWTVVTVAMLSFLNFADFTSSQSVYTTVMLQNCSLMAADSSFISKVKEKIETAKLLKLELTVENVDHLDLSERTPGHMYKPLSWVRTTSRHGRGLLLLRPEFDVLSLNTLGLGVERTNVHIRQFPENCLKNLSYSETELLIRSLVLNDFQNATDAKTPTGPRNSACNIHIRDMDGTAVFEYYCCYRDVDGTVRCEYLDTDVWLEVLFAVITFMKIYVLLFSPKFVPEAFYKEKHDPQPYIYKLTSKQLPKLKTVVTSPEKYPNVSQRVRLSNIEDMPRFKSKIEKMEHDKLCSYTLKQIHLSVKIDRLLNKNFVPVGIFYTLYESYVQCKIRDKPSVHQCCYANPCPHSTCSKNCQWYAFLKRIMSFVVLILLFTPWLLRIYVYYTYEDAEMQERKKAANSLNLDLYFPGSFSLLLTPLHVLFIIIYAVLCLESVFFNVLDTKYEGEIKSNLRSCLRHMLEKDMKEVFGWAVRLILKPFAFCGILGIFILPFWIVLILPVVFTVLAFYLFPTINITFRFLAQFVIHILPQHTCGNDGLCKPFYSLWIKFSEYLEMEAMLFDEKVYTHENILKSLMARIQHLVVIFMCIISLYSVLFLITEFLSFIVEIIIYTMIGMVLNASQVLTYVSLFLLLWFYANDCFGVVSKKFLAFNTTMNDVIFGLCKTDLDEIVFTPAHKQDNFAFTICTEQNTVTQPPELITGSDGKLRWKMQRLLLFLNKKDEPLIPKRFYFNTCDMNFYAVPGEVLGSYWRATREFAVIILFLLFVLIIVLAFGDTYKISATNKLLATIAGGFVPLILRRVVFKSYSAPSIDTGAITFRVSLAKEIESYEQSWPIFDIDVTDELPIEGSDGNIPSEVGQASDDGLNSGEIVGAFGDPSVIPMECLNISDMHETDIDLLIDASEGYNEEKSEVHTEENLV